MRPRLFAVLLCTSAFAVVLTACGEDHTSRADHQMDPMPGDGTGSGMDHHESTPVAEGARRIEVAATSFEFDPDEITVAVDEDVAIVLSSDDLLHDFAVDGIEVHVAADRGRTAEGGMRAEQPGEYTFYCTVDGHRAAGMEGTLVVEA